MYYTFQIKKRGFTIIELLVVVMIIGLLTAVATSNYVTAQRHSRDSARKAQVYSIGSAVESYYAVNKSFPGKIASVTQNVASGAYGNCEQTDTVGDPNNSGQYSYVYFYYPGLQPTNSGAFDAKVTACNNRTSVDGYDPNLFSPYPTWIPGIGPYLNPIPVDKQYQGADGTQTGAYAEVLQATDTAGSTNQTRTYVYRHLIGGYAVYTRLETSGDPDAAPFVNYNPSDSPKLPIQLLPATGSNIFMLRK